MKSERLMQIRSRRRVLHSQLQAMVAELAALDLEEATMLDPPVSSSPPETRPFQSQDRVKILWKDKCHLRTGTLLDLHSVKKRMWNIRLDKRPGDSMALIIQKIESSFELLSPVTE